VSSAAKVSVPVTTDFDSRRPIFERIT
jgi:hypothetical protein